MVIAALKANWKPIIALPEDIPRASFLIDEAFLEEFNGVVDSRFKGNKALRVFTYADKIIKNSNPFSVALTGKLLRPLGYSVSTPAQIEQVIATGALPLRGRYVDTGLVLRTQTNPNEYLAKNLTAQLKKRGVKLNHPIMIPLADVEVVNDQDSNYGLSFKLREEARLINASILKKDGNFDSKNINAKTGLPKKLGKGDRYSYTIGSSLSRLYLYGDLNLDSNDVDLAYSYDGGRVVLVASEAREAKSVREQYELKKNELSRESSRRLQLAMKSLDAGYEAALKNLK